MIELSLRDVRASHGPVEVLHGISLDLPSGSVTALIGANGAGKSTTLNVIAGLMPVSSGSVSWQGKDLGNRSAYRRSQDGMMLVPERRGVFPTLSVRDNLNVFAPHGSDDLSPALDAFPVLGERLDQLAGSLSGGEQQMLAMSRVLLQRPRLLLLDEISFGLAPRITAQLLEVVRELAQRGVTIALVEQRMADALRMADVVYVLSRGEVAFAGEPGELDATSDFAVSAKRRG